MRNMKRVIAAMLLVALAAIPAAAQATTGRLIGTVTLESGGLPGVTVTISSPAADTGGELPDPKDRIGELDALGRAEALLQNGDSKGAIALLEEVVARNPRFTDALSQLARTWEEAGRFEQAIEVQKRVIRVAPTLASEVALSLASNYLMVGRPADAEANARLALRSNAPAAHLLIGRARLAQRDFTSAEEEARQALTVESYAIPAKVLLAQTLAATQRERLPEALDLLESARREIALRSLEPVALLEFARGDVLARLNRPDEAAQAFGFEVARFPHNREAWAALAVTQILRGRSQEAQETFTGMVKENPDAGAYLLAAQTFRRFGDGERAAAWERAARARRLAERRFHSYTHWYYRRPW